jgi:hypothetical protein
MKNDMETEAATRGNGELGVFSIDMKHVFAYMAGAGDEVYLNHRCVEFLYGDIIDAVLKSFGGVVEIMDIWWNEMSSEGEVVCLMADWRVFRYYLKANDFASLSYEDRVRKINHECLVFEDMDDYGRWVELGGRRREEEVKVEVKKKVSEEKMTEYGEKMTDALSNFFNGDLEGLSKIMSKNSGKTSYLEAEA